MEPDLLAIFKPNGDALLQAISRRIGDPILERIAGMDPVGGAERFAAILGTLRKIRDQDPAPGAWVAGLATGTVRPEDPQEVLEFTSGWEPDAKEPSRWNLAGTRGHWGRAFAGAALMRAYGDEDVRATCTGIYNASLIQLLESLRALDAGFEPETMAFLAWFMLCLAEDDREYERVFAGTGLLWAAARAGDTAPDAAVVALSRWLITEERHLFEEGRGFESHRDAEELREFAEAAGASRKIADHWLFRMTYTRRHAKWIALGAELAAFDAPGPRGDAVRAVGQRLAGPAAATASRPKPQRVVGRMAMAEASEMELDLFATFRPDGDALPRAIAQRIDDPILEHLAGQDPVGGAERLAEILGELCKMRDDHIASRMSKPLTGLPAEVLRFMIFSEPDVADRSGRRRWELAGTQGHWARAFACVALIRGYVDDVMRGVDAGLSIPDLIQLLESLRALDAGRDPDAMAFLAWFILQLADDAFAEQERVLAGVGLLSIAARARDTVPDAAIAALSQWLIAEERRLFEEGWKFWDRRSARDRREFAEAAGASGRDIRDRWLFRCSYTMLYAKWIALGVELAAFDAPGPRGDAVRAVGQRLAGQRL